MTVLGNKRCVPCEGGVPPLSPTDSQTLLAQLQPEWALSAEPWLWRRYNFADYHRTMAFVNAVAWVAHQENHHPDLEVSYNNCVVRYRTHAINGLSENDFICAAKIDALLTEQ